MPLKFFRRRVPLGAALIASLVLAALAPALLVSWLLSSHSSEAIQTLAENAMSQAAHRVDVGALAHLGESHTVVNALVPPVPTAGAEAERTRKWLYDQDAFEHMAYALTQQSPNVPYLYVGTEDGTFFGVERESNGFVVRSIHPGESGRRHWQIDMPGDRSRLIRTETNVYDPRQRPWYKLAASTRQRVFTNVYRSAVKKQFDLTLAQPIYAEDGERLLGVIAVDMSLARLTDLIRSTRVSTNAVTYLVDAQGLIVASSVDENLSPEIEGKAQRITPLQSTSPLVSASYDLFNSARNEGSAGLRRMSLETGWQQQWMQALGLSSNRLMALERPFGQKYGLNWRLIVVAPEEDFTSQVTRAQRWALFAMAVLIALGATLAYTVGRRLSWQFKRLNLAALSLGSGAVPSVERHTQFQEVHNLSQVMHDSAIKLDAYNKEVQQKNLALQEAALLLEERVSKRTAELAASREEALAAVRAKAGFLAVMSHEIRTPLHGVVGMSSLLADTPLTANQRNLVDVLRISSDQLLSVVDDILDFSKIESGHLTLEHLPLNLRDTIEKVCEMVRHKAMEKGLTLNSTMDTGVPSAVMGDPTRLRQVLLNLLTNAVKFTEKGTIELHVWQEPSDPEDTLRLSVTDTGQGISPDRLPELFQPFAQGDTSTARIYGGTGLGLMICRHLVRMMGGEIHVSSTPGVGSCFDFSIQAKPVHQDCVASTDNNDFPNASMSHRVLVVDDNEVNRQVAAAMLEHLGFEFMAVESGEIALRELEIARQSKRSFNVVLLDSHMPGLDGAETARAIRSRWGLESPILIGVTASTLGNEHLEGEASGLREILHKPLTLTQLAHALHRVSHQEETMVTVDSDEEQTPASGKPAGPPDQPMHLNKQRWDLLTSLDNGVGEVRDDIMTAFMKALPNRFAALEHAAQAEDRLRFQLAAHELNGAAANVGAQAMVNICNQLEEQARIGLIDISALQLLPSLADGLRATLSSMDH